ncbi:acylneuraminate cytidylyltransferase family protein [Dehalococcoidia bacterium]|nr:acylneuraminate cytidylyltransferase family protein [Dehalococcoidia bacterium]
MAEILGLIPARGGSKGIPGKNLAPLCGRPLLSYTCDAAVQSKHITRTIISTDSLEIAKVAQEHNVERPFLRPPELSGDDAPMLSVITHALSILEENEGYTPDAVALLQPTSPLRRAEHIDSAISLLIETGADSTVTVIQVPHHFNPASLMVMQGNRIVPYHDGELILQRQKKPKVLARNGPAVLVTRRSTLLENDSLYGNDCRPVLMEEQDSLDIDTPFDLELAAFLMNPQTRSSRKPSWA